MKRTWKKVDTRRLNEPRTKSIQGITFQVTYGYDDMPTWIRGGYDDADNQFVIEFGYLDEPRQLITLRYENHVRLRVDKFSKRLYAIELDVDASELSEVNLITRAGEILKEIPINADRISPNRVENYEATSGAFQQVKEALVSS